MSSRTIQLAAILGIVAIVIVVVVMTQFPGGSEPGPTPAAGQTPTATSLPTPTTGPTSTPGPTATPSPSPTPEPTPTPQPPDVAFLAVATLASELGEPPNAFDIASYQEASWSSAALGCPEPGVLYAQVTTNGWLFEIVHKGQVLEFHSDESGENLVNCTERRAALDTAVNIVTLAGLRATTEIEFRRRDSATGTYEIWNTLSANDQIQAIVDTLDLPVSLRSPASCNPVFEVVFVTPAGNQPVRAICGGNPRLVRGPQSFWNGMDAMVPQEFSSIIGPYYSDLPVPVIPS